MKQHYDVDLTQRVFSWWDEIKPDMWWGDIAPLPCPSSSMPHQLPTRETGAVRSGLVGGGGHVPSVSGPVCVDEVSRFVQKLVCVGSKVISLGL